MVPRGTNYSAVDSPWGPLLGGTNYLLGKQECNFMEGMESSIKDCTVPVPYLMVHMFAA